MVVYLGMDENRTPTYTVTGYFVFAGWLIIAIFIAASGIFVLLTLPPFGIVHGLVLLIVLSFIIVSPGLARFENWARVGLSIISAVLICVNIYTAVFIWLIPCDPHAYFGCFMDDFMQAFAITIIVVAAALIPYLIFLNHSRVKEQFK